MVPKSTQSQNETCPDYQDYCALQAQLLEEQNRAAQARARLLSTVAQVANLLLKSPDYTTVLLDVVRLLGEAVGSDRCAFVQSKSASDSGRIFYKVLSEWSRETILSSLVSSLEHESVEEDYLVIDNDLLGLHRQLEQGEIVNYLADELPESFRHLCNLQGTTSGLVVPIFVQEAFWGHVYFDNCGESCLYDEAEIAILKVAADSIAAAIERQAKDEALQASEKHFRELFEASNDNIHFVDFEPPVSLALPIEEQVDQIYRSFRFTDINPAGERQLGLDRSEIVGQSLTVMHSPNSDGHRSLMRRLIENGWQLTNAESEDIGPDGKKRHWLSNLFGSTENGHLVRAWGITSNTTPLKEAQQALLKAEQDRTQRLRTIATLANKLLRCSDYTTVLPEVLEILGETAGSDRSSLAQNVLDPQTGKAAVKLHTQWCRAEVPASTKAIPELNSALLWNYFPDFETRLSQSETMCVQVADVAEPARKLIQALGNSSIMMVPIIVNAQFWGVFSFDYCREAKQLDEADQTIFAIAADSIAAAIERDLNQREREEMRQQRAIELTQVNNVLKASLNRLANEANLDAFLGHILAKITQQTGAAIGHVFIYESVNKTLELHSCVEHGILHRGAYDYHPTLFKAPFPADINPTFARMCETQDIVLLSPDEDHSLYWPGTLEWLVGLGMREATSFALMSGDQPVGLLGLAFTEETHFTDDNIALLRALANQVTLAIQLTQLAETTKQVAVLAERDRASQQRAAELEEHNRVLQGRDRILEATATAANALLTTENLDDAVNTALQIIGESLETDRVGVFEVEPFDQSSNLSLVGWQCLYEWHSSHTISQLLHPEGGQGNSEGIETGVERLSNGQSISYFTAELLEPFRSSMAAVGVKALHSVPIFIEGQFWGVLGIHDCRSTKHRESSELEVLKAVAAGIGSAIQRERLRLEKLRTQKAVLRAEQARSQELAHLNTELQQTLDRLSESEKRFRTLFELSSEGFYYAEVNPPCPVTLPFEEQCAWLYQNFRVVEANPAFAAMYGVNDPDTLIGLRNVDVHVADSEKNAAFIPAIIKNGYRGHNLETEEIDPQGRRRYFLNSGVCTVSEGHIVGCWATQVDITELRRTQEALLEAEKDRVTELARANDAISRTLNALTANLETDKFLSLLLAELAQQAGACKTYLFLYDADTHTLNLHSAVQEGQVYLDAPPTAPDMFRHPIPADTTEAWQMILDAPKPLTYFELGLPDSEDRRIFWPETIPWHCTEGHSDVACARMKVKDQPIGFIGFAFRHQIRLSDEQLEFIQALVNQATLAFQLTRLAEQSRQAALTQERTRIAQEIHDTLAQTFTGITVQLKLAQYLVKQNLIRTADSEDCNLARVKDILDHIGNLAQTGLAEARRSVWAVYPVDETQTALPQELADHIEQVTSGTDLQTQVTVTGTPQPLSYFVSRTLLRVCQEAITNVLKHANATTLTISLSYQPHQVSLHICDNGCGFQPQVKTEGFGLVSMSERVDQINGQLCISTQPGEGTEIFVEVST
ncbi:gaf domain protein [Leptolyngbya sp. Heron Island J]|uniref:GAF domain-containing protein n=1 Tax=Leptolyngbya sp. Heron Island J TaxID=1385935 RepID=UPI0003B95329|nr:GAF domain-containing protein [Leptolyngbya sp. Heron Island J]ESA37903.1 gaf domain protein [Leptolyngbya sp. Heron Island J]